MGQKVVQPAGKETAKTVQPQQTAVTEGQKPKLQGREAALLNLQRTHGNRHVKQMLKGGILQRQCAACGQAIAGGECAECGKPKSSLQRKLAIGASNDPLEQEADRVADQVMAAPTHSVVSSSLPHIQRYAGQATKGSDTAPASVDRVLSSPGRPLEPVLQKDMGQRFGHDFSRVRVHTDAAAERSVRDVNANAYTAGHNIVFGAGQFAPKTHEGRRLIAHELTHVVQQSGTDGGHFGQSSEKGGLSPDYYAVASSGAVQVVGASSVRIARQGEPQIPSVLSFLTATEVEKLKGFGDTDFQSSLNTLEGHLRKTKGFTNAGDTQKFIDIRQAAGELRTFRNYVNDPGVVAIKVVPSATGGRSPDMYLRYGNNDVRRVEISNVTLASPDDRPDARTNPQGQLAPKIPKEEVPGQPGKTRVVLPTNEFNDTAIKAAIRSKIKASSKGPSQLEAQNPNTRAGGESMAVGGDVVVQVTHGEVNKARLDQMIKQLEPDLLASAARRVQIDSIDAAEPRAGRKIFEYNREGQEFVGIVRRPNRPSVLELPSGHKPEGMGTSVGNRRGTIIKSVGGAILTALVQFAFAFILNKIAQTIEEAQIDSALKKIEPQIGERLNALSGEVLERQSASDQPVFATIKYSLNYIHGLEDRFQRELFFGENPSHIESNQSFHDMRKAEQNITFFADATLMGVKLAGGEQPKDQSSSSKTEDKSGTYETLVFTFEKSVTLQRFSNVELRDYVLQQALSKEINDPEEASSSERAAELRRRLDTLQGTIAKEEARKRAEEERERQAKEKRNQAKLAQAREAQKAPPPPGPPLLPQPGAPAPKPEFTPQNDPFNLGGRPQQKSLLDQAEDSADIAEALKSEFLQKADALRRNSASGNQLAVHRAEVEKWIAELRFAFTDWKAKGSPDWLPVKRFEYLVYWVDQPEGRTALMR